MEVYFDACYLLAALVVGAVVPPILALPRILRARPVDIRQVDR